MLKTKWGDKDVQEFVEILDKREEDRVQGKVAHLATKEDLTKEIANLRADLMKDNSTLRADLSKDINTLRTDLTYANSALRADMLNKISQASLAQLIAIVGTIVTIVLMLRK
ncbi:hypothetical protein EDB95_2936 [Dinghuibacter silviterrae]|uniref:Uncharacterized protein n=2 Tax=Dinghuibacter silviterrae TaxID=1539049 RepID=A0A4R8DU57_9BACT|nr:hypothetical protein EDB95_2936 [Dinghuibacter silviterrae]